MFFTTINRVTILVFLLKASLLFCQQVNINYIDSVFQKNYNDKKFNGHVLVFYKNNIVYDSFFGKADYEKNINFNKNTIFQIASISKQFTATAILLLEQQGKLSTNDYVQKHLPEYPFKEVKIAQLLNHTSGMPNFIKSMWKDIDTTKVNGNSSMFKMLKSGKYPLQWKSGQKWEYSDIAYCTAALIIEKVSGKNFKDFMSKNIFSPNKMTNTTAEFYTDIRKVPLSLICQGYEYNEQTKNYEIAYNLTKNSHVKWLGNFYGDGSVYTTAYDLIKWFKVLKNDNFLSKKFKRKLFSPTILNNGKKATDWSFNYGMGWYIGNNKNVGTYYFHAGGQAGFSSKFIICPKKDIAIVMLSNQNHIDFYSFSNIYSKVLTNK